MVRIYFPAWAERSRRCIEFWGKGKNAIKPRFGLYWNFCVNTPRAVYDATDEEIGELPDLRPRSKKTDEKWDSRLKGNRERQREIWSRKWHGFFDKVVNKVFPNYPPQDRFVKTDPHVDAKNPAAGICCLLVLGKWFRFHCCLKTY